MTDKILMDGEPLEVGDDVYCLLNGKGKVTDINKKGSFPIEVEFLCGRSTYTKNFKPWSRHENRTLYWQRPEIIPPPKLKKKVMVWDWFIKSGTSLGHHTNESEDDMKRWYPNDLIQKIDGTEREVEV